MLWLVHELLLLSPAKVKEKIFKDILKIPEQIREDIFCPSVLCMCICKSIFLFRRNSVLLRMYDIFVDDRHCILCAHIFLIYILWNQQHIWLPKKMQNKRSNTISLYITVKSLEVSSALIYRLHKMCMPTKQTSVHRVYAYLHFCVTLLSD